MKILKILLLLTFMLQTFTFANYPEHKDNYVNDFANLLNEYTSPALRNKLLAFEKETNIELVLVTINSYREYAPQLAQSLRGNPFEEFATKLFNTWGVGNMPENKGIMLLISKNDRKVRIELGRGYEKHYDEIMKEIIDKDIVPFLKENDYDTGAIVGTDEIMKKVVKRVSWSRYYMWEIIASIFVVISLLSAMIIDRKKHPAIFWMLLGSAGILIGFIISSILSSKSSHDDSDHDYSNFGGGSSDGGGASGDF